MFDAIVKEDRAGLYVEVEAVRYSARPEDDLCWYCGERKPGEKVVVSPRHGATYAAIYSQRGEEIEFWYKVLNG